MRQSFQLNNAFLVLWFFLQLLFDFVYIMFYFHHLVYRAWSHLSMILKMINTYNRILTLTVHEFVMWLSLSNEAGRSVNSWRTGCHFGSHMSFFFDSTCMWSLSNIRESRCLCFRYFLHFFKRRSSPFDRLLSYCWFIFFIFM